MTHVPEGGVIASSPVLPSAAAAGANQRNAGADSPVGWRSGTQ